MISGHGVQAGGEQYDVFVSYRHCEPESSWVRDVLVPRLRQAGVKVFIDVESFSLGGTLITEMARGVESSRYTLAVLSPDYLDSSFTDLESTLAEHLGLEYRERRLLAVLRVPCKPRLGIRARVWLDMTTDANVEQNFPRLIAAVRSS
jgi:TIR domain